MTDTGMKGRVRGLLGVQTSVSESVESVEPVEDLAQADPSSEAMAQHQALQVLTLAQRTAEEHIATAREEADQICVDARGKAEQIVRNAQDKAGSLRQEADKAVSDARSAAARLARDAQAEAAKSRRDAEKALSEARTRAAEIAKVAQAGADELKHQAQQRYDDVVGGLAARREALQRQIEALEQFDREYRARLAAFLQGQLRALWVDEPKVDGEAIESAPPAAPQASAGQRAEPDAA